MSIAFQISMDDVAAVFYKNKVIADEAMVEEAFELLEHNAIEKAALYANDIDTQTEYAHQEIEKQLKENGYNVG